MRRRSCQWVTISFFSSHIYIYFLPSDCCVGFIKVAEPLHTSSVTRPFLCCASHPSSACSQLWTPPLRTHNRHIVASRPPEHRDGSSSWGLSSWRSSPCCWCPTAPRPSSPGWVRGGNHGRDEISASFSLCHEKFCTEMWFWFTCKIHMLILQATYFYDQNDDCAFVYDK